MIVYNNPIMNLAFSRSILFQASSLLLFQHALDARKQMGKLVADHKQQLAERQTRQKRQCSGGDPWTKQPV
jgi:hypothetical protein